MREHHRRGTPRTAPRHRPGAATAEPLEPRRLLAAATGAVAGTVYADPDQSGTAIGNAGIAGRQVYVDLVRATPRSAVGDPTATTAADGTYTIAGVPQGTYPVRQVLPPGIGQTAPANFAQPVTVTAGGTATLNFGDLTLASPGAGAMSAGRQTLADASLVASAAVTQPDGKLVVLGAGNTVSRFFPDGEVDDRFGDGGTVAVTDGLVNATLTAVAVQPDGRIDVAGDDGVVGYVAQLQPNGTVVPASLRSFSASPFLADPTTTTGTLAITGLALLASGDAVVCGSVQSADAGISAAFATAYDPATGRTVTTFGTAGTVQTQYPSTAGATTGQAAVAATAAGGVDVLLYEVTDGTGTAPADAGFAVYGYAADGAQTFADVPADSLATQGFSGAVVTTADAAGRLVVIGSGSSPGTDLDGTADPQQANLTAVRLTATGALDATYGTAGVASVALGLPYAAGGVHVDSAEALPDGSVVVAGHIDGPATDGGDRVVSVEFGPAGQLASDTDQSAAVGGAMPSTTEPALLNAPSGRPAATNPVGFNNTSVPQPALIYGNRVADLDVEATAPTATLLPTAELTSAGPAAVVLRVEYTDAVAVELGTLGTGNLRVTLPNLGTAELATYLGVEQAGPPVDGAGRATGGTGDDQGLYADYEVPIPAGGFTSADDGTYVVTLLGQVSNGSHAVVTTTLGQFAVDVPASPTATLAPVATITTAGTATVTLAVTYNGTAAPIAMGTIGLADLTVTGPAGAALTVTAAVAGSAGASDHLPVTYTVAAPTGGFTPAEDGTYTVALVAGQVTDTAGTAVAGVPLGTFTVNVSTPATTPPTATLASAPPVTVGGTPSASVTVTYADASAVRLASLGAADLTVTGPAGTPLTVTAAAPNATTDASSITVTYAVAAPATGGFTTADNGTYTVSLAAGQVSDVAGNVAAASPLGTFTVAIGALSAALTGVPDVRVDGTAAVTLTVAYTGAAAALQPSTIGVGNLTVTGPDGTPLTVTAAAAGLASGGVLPVTYTLAAPPGGFTRANNGTYAVSLAAGQVTDVTGSPVPASTLGTFAVAVPPATPSTTITTATPSVRSGNVVVFTAVVTGPAGAAVPTGTVTFEDGPTTLGTAPLGAAGTATFSTADLPATVDAVTAVYSGDATDAPGRSATPATVTVTDPAITAAALTPAVPAVSLPPALLPGEKHKIAVPVTITDTGTAATKGPTTVAVYASTQSTLDADAVVLRTVRRRLSIAAGKTAKVTLGLPGLPVTLPAGTYRLLVQVTDSSGFAQTVATAETVTVAAPFTGPSVTFVTAPAAATAGRRSSGAVVLTLADDGNVALAGSVTVTLYLTTAAALPPAGLPPDRLEVTTVARPVNLPVGKARTLSVPLGLIPGVAPDSYHLLAIVVTPTANGAPPATAAAVDPTAIAVGSGTRPL